MLKKILIVIAALVVVAGAVRGYMVWQQQQDILPEFVDVPEGPRAPGKKFLGLEIDETSVEVAKAFAKSAGAKCNDTSMRALMKSNRMRIKREMDAAEARGEDPDAITGASLVNYRSKKERNPQLRLACTVDVNAFDDRARMPGAELEWLIIFDSDEHRLRHTSVSRRMRNQFMGKSEWLSALNAMKAQLGEPSTFSGPKGDEGDFGPGSSYIAKWEYADLFAEIHFFHIGKTLRLKERMEIPWPVRAKK